jgi:hypothetical protein
MKKNNMLIYSTSVLAGLLIFSLMGYRVYKANADPFSTRTVFFGTYEDTVDTTAFIIRDEQYVTAPLSGTAVPLVADGEKVAVNDPVAVICGSQKDASTYAQIKDIRQSIERYTQLNSQKNLNTVNIKGFEADIYNVFDGMLKTVESGDLSSFSDYSADFRDTVTARQIAINGAIDFSSRISELQSKLETLKSSDISAQEVFAQSAGFFVSNTDGFEKAVDYKKAVNLNYKELESLFSQKNNNTASGTIGRLVNSFNWYIAVVLDNKIASQLEIGSSMKINFPQSSAGTFTAQVKSINTSEDGKSVVIFSCKTVSLESLNFRTEKIQIVMDEIKGYKIDSEAIRVSRESVVPEEGAESTTQRQVKEYKGVYIKIGNIIRFRKVQIIYSGTDYVIAAPNSDLDLNERNEYVDLYDEIIVGGKDLYDGKILS